EDVDVRFAPRTIPATGGFVGGSSRKADQAPPVRATDDDDDRRGRARPTRNSAPTYEEGVVPPRKQDAPFYP
ncbi:MAG: hypothetical protein KDA68_22955, partial [Planctomycetaceae bacterium]|nr:hypothetical protein [Planctomycetaceae bacterium]